MSGRAISSAAPYSGFSLWRSPRLLLAMSMFFWASSFVLARAMHDVIPPVAMAYWRWLGGFLLVLAIGGWRHVREDWPTLRRHWPILLVLATFGVGAYNTLAYIGLRTTTVINASLLQSAMPLIILACSFALFGERPRFRQVIAVCVSLAGVALIGAQGSLEKLTSLTVNPGDLWIVLGMVVYSIYSALLRRRPAVHPLSFLAATFAIGSSLLLPLMIWEYEGGAVLHPTPLALLTLLYLAAFPAFLAYLFFNRGVELIGANRAGQFMHLIPVFGTVLAVLFLGESFRFYHAAGIGLIALGIALASERSKARRPDPPGADPRRMFDRRKAGSTEP